MAPIEFTVSKTIVRFIRLLLSAKSGAIMEDGGALTQALNAHARISGQELKMLISAGLINRCSAALEPTKEAKTWLRRQMSQTNAFAAQHQRLEKQPDGTTRNLMTSPLMALTGTGLSFLQPHHIEAARRVCQWGERAHLQQRVTMSYSAAHIASSSSKAAAGFSVSDMAIDARRNIARIYEMAPRECAETIIDVCVFEKGLQTIETERGWPRRSAKLVLRIGLEQLALKFGFSSVAIGQSEIAMRSWTADGARPELYE